MLQFNKVIVCDVPPVTPEELTSGEIMQQVQQATYPDAILQVFNSFIHISFIFYFWNLLVLKITMLGKEPRTTFPIHRKKTKTQSP